MSKRPTDITDLRKSNNALKDKYAAALADRARGNLHWNDCDPESLLEAVYAATEDGSAVLLGKTQDGGALVVQVWNAAGRHKLYPASMAELNEALALIKEAATS